jgi:hypothetical protein
MAEPQENTGELGWPEFIKTRVVSTITYSGVSDRLDFLNHSLLIRLRRKGNIHCEKQTFLGIKHCICLDLPVEALPSLLHLIFLTISRYNDRASRVAIIEVIKELNNWNAEVFQKVFAPVIAREAEKYGKRKPTGYSIS